MNKKNLFNFIQMRLCQNYAILNLSSNKIMFFALLFFFYSNFLPMKQTVELSTFTSWQFLFSLLKSFIWKTFKMNHFLLKIEKLNGKQKRKEKILNLVGSHLNFNLLLFSKSSKKKDEKKGEVHLQTVGSTKWK